MKSTVAVLGGGSWGSTLAHVIAKENRPVTLLVRRKEQMEEIQKHRTNQRYLKDRKLSKWIKPTLSLEEAASAGLIVVSIPAKSFREQARALGNFVQPDQILLSATKGIEPGTHRLMSQILKEETACLKIGAISGPNLALEVMDEHPTATLVASRFDEVVEQGMQVLNSSTFRAYGSHDVLGVELAGAIKNVMALAAGMITGIGYGANTRSFLISRGLSELTRIGQIFDIHPPTVSGLAGVGDLVVTCNSEKSRNFRMGMALAQGKSRQQAEEEMQQVVEGIRTTKSAYELAQQLQESFPIIETMYAILYEGLDLKTAENQLLERPMHYEHDAKRIVPRA